jgi:hypothetical protein
MHLWLSVAFACVIHLLCVLVLGASPLHLVLCMQLLILVISASVTVNKYPRDLLCCAAILLLFAMVCSSRLMVAEVGIAVFSFLAWLAWKVFKDSLMFPFALTLFGLAIMGIGIVYQSYEVGELRCGCVFRGGCMSRDCTCVRLSWSENMSV